MATADIPLAGKEKPLGALLLLVGSLSVALSGSQDAPAAAPAIRTPASSAPAAPGYCMERFERPLSDAGLLQLPRAAREASDTWTLAGGTRPDGGVEFRSSKVETSTASDLERLDDILAETQLGRPCLDVDVVIASLADPIDSGLGYQFDTHLQALRLGAEYRLDGDGYYRDRSWLPWDDRDAPSEKRAASEACRHSLPGVLLFRSNSSADRFLILLLVGETPTSGLHPVAMNRALSIAERLSDESCEARPVLNVVGPTFTGSAPSLRRALGSWMSTGVHAFSGVRIRTGSATGSSLPELLNSSSTWLKEEDVRFSATIAPEAAIQCNYLNFLYWRLGVTTADDAPGEKRRLRDVALLHESGTEFGATLASSGACKLEPGVELSFPVHVSLLRDAYEEMDRQSRGAEANVARRTSLDISLREPRRPLDFPTESSPKTTFAQDVALAHVLGTVSRRGIRHVGIQATDIGDAIFLARKIRDVVPDVRIAFFTSDVLLLHAGFDRDLAGSLVVGSYPFLGNSWFNSPLVDQASLPHDSFENETSLGVLNAMLAARGAELRQMREYAFGEPLTVLPVWTSAIGRREFIPIAVAPARDPAATIEFGSYPDAAPAAQAGGADSFDKRQKQKRDEFASAELAIERGAKLPRVWHFVFALLCLTAVLDWFAQRATLAGLSAKVLPGSIQPENELRAELGMERTKWRLYAAIRSYVLAFGVSYMAMLYACALRAYRGSAFGFTFDAHPWLRLLSDVILFAVASCAIVVSLKSACRFAKDYTALGRSVGGRSPLTWLSLQLQRRRERASDASPVISERGSTAPSEDGGHRPSLERISKFTGFGNPHDRSSTAQTSFSQLRLLANFALLLALLFTLGEMYVLWYDAHWNDSPGAALPATTLLVMRSLPLAGGASPAAPTLVCIAIVYVWAAGRMARLRLAHGVSRVSPNGSTHELVSTPLRVILHPGEMAKGGSAEAFATVERGVLNAILRPVTGPYYCSALAIIIFLPFVLFALKPLSTLERVQGTWLLATGLALCVLLIGNTLIQLVQYWIALEHLLKLILQHRLGRAFTRVASFVRDSVDDQVSRSPHDLLRFGSAVTRFDELIRATSPLPENLLHADERRQLECHRARALALRESALCHSTRSPRRIATAAEARLGRVVILAASEIVKVLTGAWDGVPYSSRTPGAPPPGPAPAQRSGRPHVATSEPPRPSLEPPPLSTDEALAAEAWRYTAEEIRWLRDAEAFAATVTSLLVNRHVRQFKYFVSTLTTCALLLLLAFSSYPFEPHRLLLTCLWAIVGSVVLTGLCIYLEMDRNSLLSRVAGTQPGKLTWNGAFVLRLVTWGLIPLLGVAAVQYPDFANTVFRLAEPLTRALR